MNKLERLKLLIERGYLPEELPPPFHANDLSLHANSLKTDWKGKACPKTRYQRFSVPRIADQRRILAITNPVAQFFLSQLIADNWTEIITRLNDFKFSITVPDIVDDKERSVKTTDFDLLHIKRMQISSNFDFILYSDISRFYSTLYTHVIPWALHGKDWCKANLNSSAYKSKLGKKLDDAVRMTQENQTLGIPVGPDTSRIISELVAVAVEERLRTIVTLNDSDAVRHIDDMTFGMQTLAGAEECRYSFERALDYYELQMNQEKTKITKSADYHDSVWPYAIREFRFGYKLWQQRKSSAHYMHKVFELSEENRLENVLDFAVKQTKKITVYKEVWPLYETFLLKSARANGTCIPTVVQILVDYNFRGYPINRHAVAKFINDSVSYHGPVGHQGEVAWALFLAKALRISIQAKQLQNMDELGCSACSLLALDLNSRGLVKGSLDKKKLSKLLTSDSLLTESWLIAYEADLKGWLVGPVPEFVSKNTFFKEMKARKISFYDVNRNVTSLKKEKKLFRAQFKTALTPALSVHSFGLRSGT